MPALRPETELYVVLIGDVYAKAHPAIQALRKMGLKIAVDTTGRKPDKQIKTADKKNIRYVLFIGENELANEQYVLKDIQTGQEEKHGLQRIVTMIKDYRRK